MSASKISRTENASSVHDDTTSSVNDKQQKTIADYRTTLENAQNKLRQLVARGDEFLNFVARPEIDDSVTKFIVEECDCFIRDDWDDDAVLALDGYIDGKKGSGKCYQWLHARLRGVTIKDSYPYATSWGEKCTFECIMMLLRYVRTTPDTIEVGKKIVETLNDAAAKYKNDKPAKSVDYVKLAKEFFATLDNDPFWDAHPLN